MSTYKGGYRGKLIYIDLSNSRIRVKPLDRDMALNYIGGRGFSSKILYEELGRGVDPLAPDNLFILATGPLNGTPIPSASRLIAATKSPMTGVIGDTSSGGYWASELKYAGYDGIVITGKATAPVYVWIEDGRVELRSAEAMWGKRIHETGKLIRADLGKDDIRICAIGPGGENLVRYACIVTDEESVGGRCGLGAVMGSKNLKAVVVRGSQDVPIADPSKLQDVIGAYIETLNGEAWTDVLRKLGTPNLVAHRQRLGIWGAKNFQAATIDRWEDISGETFREKYLVKTLGCMGCRVRCRRYSRIKNGPIGSFYTKGPEYDSINALGAKPYITNSDIVLSAHYLSDELGIDEQTAGSAISMAMELYERGMLKKEDVDGVDLVFGNGEALLDFIEKIAYRRGFGNVLAEGTMRMGESLNANYYAMHVKGLEVDATDPRAGVTRALTYSVSTRGSCHLRGFPYIDEFIKPEEAMHYFGTQAVSDIASLEGKGKMVAWSENWITLANLLGLCLFAWYRSRDFSMLIRRGLNLATDAFAAATGLEVTPKQMMICGERVYNVEKLFNLREGLGREADYPPKRFFEEGLDSGPGKGAKLSYKDYDKVLNEYYASRGWDQSTGHPTEAKLEELGLKVVNP